MELHTKSIRSERHRSVQCSSAMDLTDHCSFAMTNDTNIAGLKFAPKIYIKENGSVTDKIVIYIIAIYEEDCLIFFIY